MKQGTGGANKARALKGDRPDQKAQRIKTRKRPALSAAELHIENMLDEASRQSFPASDPPAWISSGR